jgi:hypothetical protein
LHAIIVHGLVQQSIVEYLINFEIFNSTHILKIIFIFNKGWVIGG